MGVVYAAEDSRLPGRIVALKVVSWSGDAGLDDPMRRFVREAKILEKLRHPNIVSFLEVGLHEGKTYFAMELLDGMPLTAYVGRPWTQLVPVLIQVCYGMEYLSARGIVHRDLSPDNVLIVRKDGRPLVKILDFGIAKDTEQQETLYNFTKTGVLMGKPHYWSPELIGMLDAGEKIDWRSDVYTLGIIFYRVLSGTVPFVADSPLGYMNLHLTQEPVALVAPLGLPPVPQAISSLVQKMMAKNRINRPASYAEIITVLRDAFDAAPGDLKEAAESFVVFRPATPPTPSGRPGTAPARSAAAAGLAPPGAGEAISRIDSIVVAGGEATTRAEDSLRPHRDTPATVAIDRKQAVRPQPKRSRVLRIVAALAFVACLATAVWLAVRPAPRVVTKPPAPPASVSMGHLALHSLPWGRVVAVTDERDGRRVPLDETVTTPVVLDLPPARYSVEVVSSVGDGRERVSVEIRPGEVVTRSIVFVDAGSALGLLD
jgi:predicted Ser/Thr protein kinase